MPNRIQGMVKWFDVEKGYGMLEQPAGDDVFCHYTSIQGGGPQVLNEGQGVEFEINQGPKGLQAVNVIPLD